METNMRVLTVIKSIILLVVGIIPVLGLHLLGID